MSLRSGSHPDLTRHHRAMLLRPYVKNKSVLEIGCGLGEISAMLAKDARRVLAIDNELHLINLAQEDFALPNLVFEAAIPQDVTSGPFDIVVALAFPNTMVRLDISVSLIRQLMVPQGIFVGFFYGNEVVAHVRQLLEQNFQTVISIEQSIGLSSIFSNTTANRNDMLCQLDASLLNKEPDGTLLWATNGEWEPPLKALCCMGDADFSASDLQSRLWIMEEDNVLLSKEVATGRSRLSEYGAELAILQQEYHLCQESLEVMTAKYAAAQDELKAMYVSKWWRFMSKLKRTRS